MLRARCIVKYLGEHFLTLVGHPECPLGQTLFPPWRAGAYDDKQNLFFTFQLSESDMNLSHSPIIEQKSSSTQAIDRLRAYRSVYEQLPLNESQTRVLRLHSHSSNATPVTCSLEVMTLDPEPSMVYSALSYVWGDAYVTEDIMLNGVSFAVTSNLASALKQIRKGFGEVLLWADAICTLLGDKA